jgi:hypothetical protein
MSTQPYPIASESWRKTRTQVIDPTKGRRTGRKKRQPTGFTSWKSFPGREQGCSPAGPAKRRYPKVPSGPERLGHGHVAVLDLLEPGGFGQNPPEVLRSSRLERGGGDPRRSSGSSWPPSGTDRPRARALSTSVQRRARLDPVLEMVCDVRHIPYLGVDIHLVEGEPRSQIREEEPPFDPSHLPLARTT